MADDISIKVNFDDGDFASKVAAMQSQVDALNSSTSRGAEGLTKVESSAKKAGSEAEHAASSHNKLSEAMEQLGKHSRTVSVGMEAVGLSAGEAASKVEGLTEAFLAMESAVPAVLAVAAAGALLFATIDYFKEAASAASDMQAQMESLGASVSTQGGNWDEQREKIEAWAASESMASGVTQGELIKAMNDLVTAGNSVHDSQILIGVAEEVSIGKHRSLAEVTEALKDAENGRSRGLLQLDGNLRKVIDAHGTMDDVLKILHHDFEKSLSDDNSLQLAHARLSAAQEAVSESIGNKLLPMLTSMSYTFLGALHNAELLGTGISDVFSGIVKNIQEAMQAAGSFGHVIADIASGNFKGAAADWKTAGETWNKRSGDKDLSKGYAEIGKELTDPNTAEQQGRHMAGAAVKEHVARLDAPGGLTLDHDHNITNHKDKKAGQPVHLDDENLQPLTKSPKDTNKAAQESMEESLKKLTASEQGYRDAVTLASTADEKDAASKNALMHQIADLNMASTELATQNAQDKAKVNELTAEQNHAISAGNSYEAQIRSITAAVNKSGTESTAQKDKLKQLHAELENAKTKTGQYGQQIDQLNGYIKKNTDEIERNNQTIHDGQVGAAAATANGIASLSQATDDANDKLNEFLATSNMSVNQKFAYYTAKAKKAYDDANAEFLAGNTNAANEDLAHYTEYMGKKNSIIEDSVKTQEEAQKKLTADETKMVSQFVDTVLIQHKGLGAGLKDVFSDIEKQFEKMIVDMVIKSKLLDPIMKSLQGMFGGGSSDASIVPTPASIASVLGGGKSSSATPTGTSGNPIHVDVESTDGSKLGPTQGLPTNAVQQAGSTLAKPGNGQPSKNWGNSSYASDAIAGAGLGGLASGFFGGSQQDGQLGGALGGILSKALLTGGAAAGPAGAIISAAAGIFGGLFGSKSTPQDMPDQSDQIYQKETTDLASGVRQWGFNGQSFAADQQYNAYAGNKNLSEQMAQYAQTVNQQSLNATQEALYQQMQALNPNDNPEGWGVFSERQGVDTLNSGKTVSVSDYDSMIENYQMMMGASSNLTPQFTLNRINGGATSNLSELSASGAVTAISYNGANQVPGTANSPATVNITINGSVVGNNGMSQLATIVSQELNTNLINNNSSQRNLQ